SLAEEQQWTLASRAMVRDVCTVEVDMSLGRASSDGSTNQPAGTHFELEEALDGEALVERVDQFRVRHPARWYAKVHGPPPYWPLVVKYDEWLTKARGNVLAKRPRGVRFRGEHRDEYGMLNFGDAIHEVKEDTQGVDYGVHGETEYYDFPHALFVHFFRTGDLLSLRTAIEAAARRAARAS